MVTRRHVLTAAHCVERPKVYRCDIKIQEYIGYKDSYPSVAVHYVIVGMMSEKIEDGEKMLKEKFFIHPERDPSIFANDLAIIKLASDIKLSERVKPICIGDQSHRLKSGDQVSRSN